MVQPRWAWGLEWAPASHCSPFPPGTSSRRPVNCPQLVRVTHGLGGLAVYSRATRSILVPTISAPKRRDMLLRWGDSASVGTDVLGMTTSSQWCLMTSRGVPGSELDSAEPLS
jgi:hypothetical protein